MCTKSILYQREFQCSNSDGRMYDDDTGCGSTSADETFTSDGSISSENRISPMKHPEEHSRSPTSSPDLDIDDKSAACLLKIPMIGCSNDGPHGALVKQEKDYDNNQHQGDNEEQPAGGDTRQFTRFTIANILREPSVVARDLSSQGYMDHHLDMSRESGPSCSEDDDDDADMSVNIMDAEDIYRQRAAAMNASVLSAVLKRSASETENERNNSENEDGNPRFSWLQCTRYRPPKLPSKLYCNKNNIYIYKISASKTTAFSIIITNYVYKDVDSNNERGNTYMQNISSYD